MKLKPRLRFRRSNLKRNMHLRSPSTKRTRNRKREQNWRDRMNREWRRTNSNRSSNNRGSLRKEDSTRGISISKKGKMADREGSILTRIDIRALLSVRSQSLSIWRRKV